MAFLQNEKARLQAEVQAAGAQITSLTTQLQTQQQAVVTAQGRVSAAQTRVADGQSKIPALEAAAASADQRAESANQAVENHSANEPDPLIEVGGRPPRPNPAWRTWKTQMDRLTQQLSAAQTEAGAAHGRLNDGRSEVSLALAERQAAERQVTDANNPVAATQQAIAAARQRQDTVQAQIATLDRWNDEIARDPLVRPALEPIAAELSGRAAALEEAFAVARVQREIAEETRASLIARRDQLTPVLNQVNGQLPGASEELRVARVALTSASRTIQNLRRRGPLP
jgi:chromosome segregation ATPase